MRAESSDLRFPAPNLRSSLSDTEAAALGIDRWRELPRAQTPPWQDVDELTEVCQVLTSLPPMVAPYEVDELRERLALVAEGGGFLLQGGDSVESFADNTEEHLLANLRLLLQMAVVL